MARSASLRKLASRALLALGVAGFACTFPEYSFPSTATDTCNNGAVDSDETGLDCGGACPACECESDADCPDGECQEGSCLVESCEDGVHNGNETSTDCGGSCADGCEPGEPCQVDDDCDTGVCDGTCQPASCDDGVTNGGESATDCGAVCPELCANGDSCNSDADCQSDTCADTVCAPALCSNNLPDPGETDVDCGGETSMCPRCDTDESCDQDSDCKDLVCEASVCLASTCDDRRSNGQETDVDCGGSDCDPCEAGEGCLEDEDCLDANCVDEVCQEATCDDEIRNGQESDVDCGGDDCQPCPDGDSCREAGDCRNLVCAILDEPLGRCAAASCEDQVQNGDELGLDCGGNCELCQLGDPCSSDAGCASFWCDESACVEGISVGYRCGQCGEQVVSDMVSYTLTLTNLSDQPLDLDGLSLRYYLSAETTEGLDFSCSYEETISCGGDPRLLPSGIDMAEATHHIEVTLGSELPPLEAGASASVFIEVDLGGGSMNQDNDYSFNKDIQEPYGRTTAFRDGILIWGDEPAPTN